LYNGINDNATPGASIAVHTYGDFLNFNPHIHAIVPDGCFLGKITDAAIENMMSWHHS
jgi:hypothetical protein